MKILQEILPTKATDNPEPLRVVREDTDMNTDPYVPTSPVVDQPKHARAGITTNKMQPRNKARARMARESRKRNRG